MKKYVNLVDIGEILPMAHPNWSKKLALVHTFEGIYRNFDVFHVKMAIYEFELEK